MAERLHVTRIDFAVAGDMVIVNKLDDQTHPERALVIESNQKPATELESMLSWCAEHGWTVRRFIPLGARAWKGEARVIRSAGQIIKRRSELTKYPVPGLEVNALDLAYDC